MLCNTYKLPRLQDIRIRPYSVECTRSRSISEVKQPQAGLVLGWVTAWEYPVSYPFSFSLRFCLQEARFCINTIGSITVSRCHDFIELWIMYYGVMLIQYAYTVPLFGWDPNNPISVSCSYGVSERRDHMSLYSAQIAHFSDSTA